MVYTATNHVAWPSGLDINDNNNNEPRWVDKAVEMGEKNCEMFVRCGGHVFWIKWHTQMGILCGLAGGSMMGGVVFRLKVRYQKYNNNISVDKQL